MELRERIREWIVGVIQMARAPTDQDGGPRPTTEDLADYAMTSSVVALIREDAEVVAWRVEIECPNGPYVEHWDAKRRDRAWAQHQEASEAGDLSRMFPLYRHPPDVERLREALEEIRDHPACSYDYHAPTDYDGDRQYQIGVTDGHRLAAKIARRALNQGDEG